MKNAACDETQDTMRRPGFTPGGDADMAAHLRSCPSCSEALEMATWLRAAARRETGADRLPSASQIWWRAQIIRDLVEQESLSRQVTRPARWMQWTGAGLVGLLTALFITFQAALLLEPVLDMASSPTGWRWLAGLLVVGTVLPLAAFTALWVTWREA
ncbi:MAG: hypothetical protein GY719_41160 [bacterium]|nr:hypothetical protein [bacterium]